MTDQPMPPAPEGGPSSPKEARAQARIARAQRKASRNWFLRHKFLSAGAVIIVIIIIAAVASSGGSGKGKGDTAASTGITTSESAGTVSHAEDVKIAKCDADDLGFADSQVVLTNHSSKSSDYIVSIAYETPDGKTQIGTGNVIVNNLGPNQSSSQQDADSLQKATGPYTCRVASVTRVAAAS